MIFEMRQYLIARGRMDDNHARMRDHLPSLLRKHGITVVGRWTALAGPRLPMFCYIMQWKTLEEREACWASFYADPEWTRVRAETNAGSELVEGQELVFLRPHPAFAATGEAPATPIGGIHQLITQRTVVGRNAELSGFLSDACLPALHDAGAHVIGGFDLISGPRMPSLVMLLAWTDTEAWRRGWATFNRNVRLREACDRQRAELGATLFGDCDSLLLEPAPYALPFASLPASLPKT